jgi:nucleoside-diphosphate-sugar epimerase
MKAAIVGASGFLGKALTRHLRQCGWDVLGYDLAPPVGQAAGLPRQRLDPERQASGLPYECVDVLGDEVSFPRGTEAVYYLAQSPRYHEFPQAAEHLFGVNTLGAIKAARAAWSAGVRAMCYASSGNVYAPSFGPLAETSPLRRDEPYALSKLAAEEALRLFGPWMSVVAVRLFGLFGPGQVRMLPPRLLARIRAGEEIVLEPAPGDAGQTEGLTVSFTFVDDAASILERLVRPALAGTALPPAINVAGPEPISVRRFAEEIGRTVGIAPRLVRGETPRRGDLIADISLLGSLIHPQYTPFPEAIAETCKPATSAMGGPEPCR